MDIVSDFFFGIIFWLHDIVMAVLWIYYMYAVIFSTITAILWVAFKLTRAGTRINYVLCFSLFIFCFWLIPGLIFPIFLARPFHRENAYIMSWFQRKISHLAGFTYEMRGLRYVPEHEGGIIVCNHQTSLDILADMSCGLIKMRWRGTISKKELLYIFPLGPASYLCNIIFIDRKNPKSSYRTMEHIGRLMKEEKMKILFYPEGTRSMRGGILPFKKGAFMAAIQTQMPIFPQVYCPYYYYDAKRKVFLCDNKHHIVSCLEAVPTEGLTEADVDDLKQKVYDLMVKEYEKLKEEVEIKSKDPNWINQSRPRMTIFE